MLTSSNNGLFDVRINNKNHLNWKGVQMIPIKHYNYIVQDV